MDFAVYLLGGLDEDGEFVGNLLGGETLARTTEPPQALFLYIARYNS